jgi:energy-coupling factor transporter ATP-binding protein EcfA2
MRLRNVSFRHPGDRRPVLSDVNLSVERGEWVSVVGPTGSGKSTLGRLCAGLLVPDRGHVHRHDGLRVGWMPQDATDAIVASTVGEDVAFGPANLGLRGAELEARVLESLLAVGLDATYVERDPLSLSGGECQRVVLAGLLAMQPSLLILDEPTSMLDGPSRRIFLNTLSKAIATHGLAVICITHDLHEAGCASRVVAIQEGRVINEGTPERVLSSSSVRAALHGRVGALCDSPVSCNGPVRPVEVQLALSSFSYSSLAGSGEVLMDVSLRIRPGAKVAITGRSGAGKSTLLLAVAGLLKVDDGVLSYGSRVISDNADRRWLRSQVGIALQHPERQLFADSVWNEVMFGPLNLGENRSEAQQLADMAMRCAGLDPDVLGPRSPFALSGGEQRQVALASVLATKSPLLILDEPTAGLHQGAAKQIMCSIDHYLQSTGASCCIATHDLELAQAWADEHQVLRAEGRGARTRRQRPFYAEAHSTPSPMQNLDPRATILATSLLALAATVIDSWRGWFVLVGGLVLIYGVARVSLMSFSRLVRPFLPLACVAVLLSNEGSGGSPLANLGSWVYSTADLKAGLWSAAKMLLLVSSVGWLTLTTAPRRLVEGLRLLVRFVPGVDEDRLGMGILVAFRFVPIVRTEAKWLRLAQTARGADLQKGVVGVYRRLVSTVVPLLAGVWRRADALAEALVMRGYGAHRSNDDSQGLGRDELLLLVGVLTLMLVSVLLDG